MMDLTTILPCGNKGNGLFVCQNCEAGDVIFTSADGDSSRNWVRRVNHSCQANAVLTEEEGSLKAGHLIHILGQNLNELWGAIPLGPAR